MKALRRINKFIHLPFKEKLWMGEALFYLIWYSFLIHMVPFRWWESRIGKKMQPLCEDVLDLQQQNKIRKIRASVLRSNKVIGGLGKCFAMSLTLKKILNRRYISTTVFIGIQKEGNNQYIGHSWLKYWNYTIYGGSKASEKYKQLLVYT